MSRPNQIVTQFPALDHEPRGQGPPPSYRNSAATEDSWSTMSGSGPNQSMSGRRGNSWANLVQVGGDPLAPKQAPPRPAAPMSTTFSVNSRTSSLMGLQQPTVFTTQFSEIETVHARIQSVRYIDENGDDSGRSTSRDTVTEVRNTQGQPLQQQKVFSTDPRMVSIPRPAGTIHSTSSMPPSRAGSIITGPNPSPPRSKKNEKDSKKKQKKQFDSNMPKRNRLQELKNFCKRPSIMGCCLCLLLALIVAIVVIIILSQVLPSPKEATFVWIAPPALANGQNSSSKVEMKADKQRIRFQIQGSPPIKGNYINYYDFDQNQVVVIDQSLSANGKNLYCFLLPLDRSSMPNPGDVRKAAKSSVLRHQQSDGWQQVWSWIPSPLQMTSAGQSMFNPPIPECNGSRIVQLQQTSDQRNRRCTDCYDFCLPQYGIMRNASDNNDEYLNIKQQDCFYLFVPEWRTYAQANTIEQNQQDFENYYRNRQHMQVSYGSNGPNDSRWIPLSGMPRQMMNATGAFVGQVGNAIGNLGSNVYGMVTGQNGQQNPQALQNQNPQNTQGMQQQQNYGVPPNAQVSLPYGVNNQFPNTNQNPSIVDMQQQRIQNQQAALQNSRQPSGYHPAVNGVVNLNGVNGQNGNTEYNVQPYQGTQGVQPSSGQNIGPEMRRQAPYNFQSNVNSGYTNQQPSVSSGSTNMNGFGANPSYQTSQYGFNNNDPRNQVGGLNGNGLGNSVNSQHQISVSAHTNAPRIGTVLNEFGNPVNIPPSQHSSSQLQNQQQQQGLMGSSQQVPPGYGGQITNPNFISTSGGVAPDDGGSFNQRLQALMGSPPSYRPDVEPVNYNVPTYSQPNRPDALSRQGRIFK